MSIDPTTTPDVITEDGQPAAPAEVAAPTLSLQDVLQRAVVSKVVVEDFKATGDAYIRDAYEAAVANYTETGSKSFEVKGPDGSPVATFSLRMGEDSIVVDDEATFIAWAEEKYGEAAVEMRPVLRPSFLKLFLDKHAVAHEDAVPEVAEGELPPESTWTIFDSELGEPVEGLRRRPAPDGPTGHSITWKTAPKKGADDQRIGGKQRLTEHLRSAGRLAAIEGTPSDAA